MLSTREVMTFVATKDPARARQFYEGTLGLHFVADEQYTLVFDLNGVMLRVQKVADLSPAPYTSLGWKVEDIAGAVTELGRRSVVFERYEGMPQDELGVWTAPGDGARVAWFKDPDGNLLSLTES